MRPRRRHGPLAEGRLAQRLCQALAVALSSAILVQTTPARSRKGRPIAWSTAAAMIRRCRQRRGTLQQCSCGLPDSTPAASLAGLDIHPYAQWCAASATAAADALLFEGVRQPPICFRWDDTARLCQANRPSRRDQRRRHSGLHTRRWYYYCKSPKTSPPVEKRCDSENAGLSQNCQ